MTVADAKTVRRPRKGAGRDQRQKVKYTELNDDVRSPRMGWTVIAGKEFADLILSVRFLVLVLILALAGAGMIYAIAGEIKSSGASETASSLPSIFLLLFTITPANLPISFVWIVSFLGPLLGIAFGFDAVNGERTQGTLPRLLSQPIHRDDVINGKFVAGLSTIGLGLAVVMVLISAIGIIQLGITPNAESVLRLITFWLISIVYIGFWLALAQLFSVVLRSAAASALVSFGIWILVSVFGLILAGLLAGFIAPGGTDASPAQQINNATVQNLLSQIAPTTLFQQSTAVLLDPSQHWAPGSVVLQAQVSGALQVSFLSFDQSLLVIWPQIVTLIALTVLIFAIAYVSFMRQEVRA